MTRQGRLAVIVLVSAAAGGIALACSFPDVQFNDDATEGGSGSSGSSGGTNDGGVDASTEDAQTRPDGSQVVTEAGCKNPCDCDNDTYINRSCLEAGADASQIDCDDFDPLRHPDSGFVPVVPPGGDNMGDWDCDGVVTPQYPTGLQCFGTCGPAGFKGTVGCGVKAAYYMCSGTLCPATVVDERPQGCR